MAAKIGPKLVIFSDLDGTFLDHDSYASTRRSPPSAVAYRRARRWSFAAARRARKWPSPAGIGSYRPVHSGERRRIFVPHGYFPFPVDFDFHFDRFGVINWAPLMAALTSALDYLSHSLGIQSGHFITDAVGTGRGDGVARLEGRTGGKARIR